MRPISLSRLGMKWSSIGLLIFISGAVPFVLRATECKVVQRNACNVLLFLDEADKAQAETTHLPYGIPTPPAGATNEKLLHQSEYIINYDADLLVPTWVGYRLRDSDIQERDVSTAFVRILDSSRVTRRSLQITKKTIKFMTGDTWLLVQP